MKQAVVVIHGMGEQIPMETLVSFVDATWTTDESLVDRGKPDPDTGARRRRNASWSKPDRRNRSFELRVITTETGKNRKRTDFYEFYWAHHMVDTTWAHVRGWLLELMLRNPFTRVPPRLMSVWILLWAVAAGALALATLQLGAGDGNESSWRGAMLVAAVTAAIGWLTGFLVRYFGDVARYVKAKPANVARRQEIREEGVQLLETLMGVRSDSRKGKSEYDRIVVVGHSLGSIVAYDILTHAFARIHDIADKSGAVPEEQPARLRLEDAIRRAAGMATVAPPRGEDGGSRSADVETRPVPPEGLPLSWSIEEFQEMQAQALGELNRTGNPWIVSDFVTLGSPLTHAEFLLARDRARLAEAKRQRQLPSCPPTLEYDRSTRLHHFTYRPDSLRRIGDSHDPEAPRVPHHAALFAYTRWSNIYSPSRFVAWGDIISGPLGSIFGLESSGGTVKGIRDIAVLPALDEAGKRIEGERRPFFTHTGYWKLGRVGSPLPRHIARLREALRLGD
ncbi:hypothetical protein [Sphingosinicella sp. CPCC 101087]|uniref:hypothetical protein n=1 Tax=Sphingosinicella sp. CPCC 101087 TaxID=2497754 RepID=UPI00101D8A8F|nr:hypothetical protein [Sphingosinicella sp. CPCC 101087]